MGLIERLNANDSFGELWNALTISAKPLVGDPEDEDLHANSVCRVLLTWTHVTRWPVLTWIKPPTESYDALERLIDHIVAEPEWLPNDEGPAREVRLVPTSPAIYARWAAWSLLPIAY